MAYADILSARRIEEALWQTMKELQNEAVKQVPVDTGNLRNAITIATNKRRERYGPVIAAKAHLTGEIASPVQNGKAVFGVNVAYAHDVEYGKPDKPNYPAQPFLRPAIDIMKKRFAVAFAAVLKGSIALDIKGTVSSVNYRRPRSK